MRVAGYRLRDVGGGKTELVYLIDVDLGRSFAPGFLHRRMAQRYIKGVVDMH